MEGWDKSIELPLTAAAGAVLETVPSPMKKVQLTPEDGRAVMVGGLSRQITFVDKLGGFNWAKGSANTSATEGEETRVQLPLDTSTVIASPFKKVEEYTRETPDWTVFPFFLNVQVPLATAEAVNCMGSPTQTPVGLSEVRLTENEGTTVIVA